MDNYKRKSYLFDELFGTDVENKLYDGTGIEKYPNTHMIEEEEEANVEEEEEEEVNVEGAEINDVRTQEEGAIITQEEDEINDVQTVSQTECVEIDAVITQAGDGINNGETGLQTGMQYATLYSLFNEYQEHAKRAGFSVMKRTCRKTGGDEYRYVLFVCRKSGKPMSSVSKRIDCKARLNAKKQIDGSWVVSKMCSDHNHELDPQLSILMPAHGSISTHLKRQLEANDRAGIKVSENIRLVEVQSGGPENLRRLPKDIRNFMNKRRRLRRLRIGGDVEAQKKLEEVEKLFEEIVVLAFGNIEKMDFIKRELMELNTKLQNWNTTTTDNGS